MMHLKGKLMHNFIELLHSFFLRYFIACTFCSNKGTKIIK
jgi:hypothetical protein